MPHPRVYVETTIPSFYFDERTAPEVVAMRRWTRDFWAGAPTRFELETSLAVLREILVGPDHRQLRWLTLLRDLPLLPLDSAIFEIAEAYIRHKLMPGDPSGDALHLALASYHKCDFLLTWNFKHLANANKFDHIRRVNTMLGLFVPAIVTPFELLEKNR